MRSRATNGWRWTGVEIARGVRSRLIYSCEAVKSGLAHPADQRALNALVEVSLDEALDMADTTNRAVALCCKEDNLWTCRNS